MNGVSYRNGTHPIAHNGMHLKESLNQQLCKLRSNPLIFKEFMHQASEISFSERCFKRLFFFVQDNYKKITVLAISMIGISCIATGHLGECLEYAVAPCLGLTAFVFTVKTFPCQSPFYPLVGVGAIFFNLAVRNLSLRTEITDKCFLLTKSIGFGMLYGIPLGIIREKWWN